MEKENSFAKKKRGEKRMHKEWIICVIIIAFIIIGNILTQNYTKQSVETMNQKLENLKGNLIKEDVNKENVQTEMEDIMKDWKNRNGKLAYFIEHDELEKVETELTSLKANIGVEEYKQGVSDLDKSIFILKHIKEKFKLEIKNIF